MAHVRTLTIVGGESSGPSGDLMSMIESGESLLRAGRLAEARTAFMDAAATAEYSEDGASLVRAALGVGGVWVHEQRDVVARATVDALWQRAAAVAPVGTLGHAR